MKKKILAVLVLIASGLLLVSCKKEQIAPTPAPITPPPPPPVTPKNEIVFVYKTDNSEGMAYKTLMEANNCNVTLVDVSTLTTLDFSPYQLVVVGNNTDTISHSFNSHWDIAQAAAIQNSSKPVLLIGMGGLRLGDALNLSSKKGSCIESTNISKMTVINAANSIYRWPKTIGIPANNQVDLFFTSASKTLGIYLPVTSGVEAIGKWPFQNNYATVSLENSRYGVFGYGSSVSDMTQAGKDFLVNLSYFVGRLYL